MKAIFGQKPYFEQYLCYIYHPIANSIVYFRSVRFLTMSTIVYFFSFEVDSAALTISANLEKSGTGLPFILAIFAITPCAFSILPLDTSHL